MGNSQGLAIHNADGLNAGQGGGLDFIDDKASYEEVAGWGVAFDRLMKNKSKFFYLSFNNFYLFFAYCFNAFHYLNSFIFLSTVFFYAFIFVIKFSSRAVFLCLFKFI
jgi:hypothetical protein